MPSISAIHYFSATLLAAEFSNKIKEKEFDIYLLLFHLLHLSAVCVSLYLCIFRDSRRLLFPMSYL